MTSTQICRIVDNQQQTYVYLAIGSNNARPPVKEGVRCNTSVVVPQIQRLVGRLNEISASHLRKDDYREGELVCRRQENEARKFGQQGMKEKRQIKIKSENQSSGTNRLGRISRNSRSNFESQTPDENKSMRRSIQRFVCSMGGRSKQKPGKYKRTKQYRQFEKKKCTAW